MKKIDVSLKSGVKKILWTITGGYQPKKFWDKRAKTFMDDEWQVRIHSQHHWAIKEIKKINPKRILEVGCGFGRNIKFLIGSGVDPKKIVGIDISSVMIKKARKYVKNKNVKLFIANASDLPFKNKEFDMVLVHGVFMHIKPQDINQSLDDVLRVTKKFVIVIEQNYDGNEYTFVHAYKSLFKKRNLKIVKYVYNKKIGLDYFLLRKNEK